MVFAVFAITLAANQFFLLSPASAQLSGSGIELDWVKANLRATPRASDRQQGTLNYFSRDAHRTGISIYKKVRFESIYPGIDIVYYENGKGVEYDLEIAPGADIRRAVFRVRGASRVAIDTNGDLLLNAANGPLRLRKPSVYQAPHQEIDGGYALRADGSVGFRVGKYDNRRPLIIDPTIAYSTYLTGDAGATGRAVAVDAAGNFYVTGVTASSNFPTVAAISGAKGGVSKSNNSGASWTPATVGLDPNVQQIAIDPVTPSTIYAASFSGALKSVNGGAAWTNTSSGLTSIYLQAIAVDPNTPTTLYAGTHLFSGIAGGVFKSVDSGATWTSVGLATSDIQSITVSASSPPSIYAAALDGLYVSVDGGASWTHPITGAAIRAIALDPSQSMVAYVVGGGGNGVINGAPIERTSDGGAHWQSISSSSSTVQGLVLTRGGFALGIDPGNPSHILAGGALDDGGSGAVFSSVDGGSTWKATSAPNCFYRALAFDPKTPNVVYAGCQRGVYKSVEGGSTWTSSSAGIGSFNIYALAVDPKTPANVYAGSRIASAAAFVSKFSPAGSLVYSTYLEGGAYDEAFGIAVDASGNAYVTGRTTSSGFPTTSGAFQTTYSGGYDAFVTKLNPTGSLAYSTFLGGSADDIGYGIAVDGAGNAMITGLTVSKNLPLVNPVQSTFTTSSTPFAAKLNAAGSSLVYSTYLGAGGVGIAADAAGNAYITGAGNPATFAPTSGALSAGASAVVRLSPAGSISYVAYVSGQTNAIAVDAAGSAYVTGNGATSLVTTPGAFQTSAPSTGSAFHAFVSKLNPTGTAYVYSTYVTGSSQDQGWAIAVDAASNAYITGSTNSLDFPLVNPVAISIRGRLNDAFVSKLNAAGSALLYSTYTGSSGNPIGYGIAVDASGNAYVAGLDNGTDFPVTAGAVSTNGATGGAFVMKLASSPDAAPLLRPAIGAAVDSASFAQGATPGSLASIFGGDLGYPSGGAASIPLPRALNGTTVTVNGSPVPLLYVSPGQINFQLPWETAAGASSTMVITAGGSASPAKQFQVATYGPAVFTAGSYGTVLIANTGGSLAAPVGAFPGSRPVKRGEYIEIYCTGLGPVAATPATGTAGTAASTTLTQPTVTFGSPTVTGTVTYSGLAPGLVGLYQVDVLVPDSAPSGYVYITVRIGGVGSQAVGIQIQ